VTRKKPAQPAKPKADQPFFRPFEAVAKELASKEATGKEAGKATAKTSVKPPAHAAKPGKTEAAAGPEPSFAEMLYGVKPIGGGKAKVAPKPAPPPSTEADDEARAALHALVQGGDGRFEVYDDGQRVEGRRLDVDAKVLRRLRRGELVIDVKLDLHGLTVSEARARVGAFLKSARARGERVALVVHGRGNNSPRGVPILRGEVASWLSEADASTYVAAFCTALPDDGGDGALYVLLRG